MFSFPCHRGWQGDRGESQRGRQTILKHGNKSQHTNVCVPAVALYCLFPDTTHHLARIKIYLTWYEHREAKRGGQPNTEMETLSQEATKEIFQIPCQGLGCWGHFFFLLWFCARINFWITLSFIRPDVCLRSLSHFFISSLSPIPLISLESLSAVSISLILWYSPIFCCSTNWKRSSISWERGRSCSSLQQNLYCHKRLWS